MSECELLSVFACVCVCSFSYSCALRFDSMSRGLTKLLRIRNMRRLNEMKIAALRALRAERDREKCVRLIEIHSKRRSDVANCVGTTPCGGKSVFIYLFLFFFVVFCFLLIHSTLLPRALLL